MNMFEEDEEFSLSSLSSTSRKNNNKKKSNNNKKRFTDDQIRTLESIFESETKLEPQKKMILARELGLEPRQVAIWFQNKRARRKSKQLEQDYDVLLDSYTSLASQFEALKKENQALMTQVQKLKDTMMQKGEGNHCCSQSGAAGTGEEEQEGERRREDDECALRPVLSQVQKRSEEQRIGFVSDEEEEDSSIIKAEYFGLDEEPELVTMVEPADSSLTSPEDWASLGTDDLLDQSCSSSHQWWDFWS